MTTVVTIKPDKMKHRAVFKGRSIKQGPVIMKYPYPRSWVEKVTMNLDSQDNKAKGFPYITTICPLQCLLETDSIRRCPSESPIISWVPRRIRNKWMAATIDKMKRQFTQQITARKPTIAWRSQKQCQGAWSGQEIYRATSRTIKTIDIFKIKTIRI